MLLAYVQASVLLIQVAVLLQKSIRISDAVSRFSGDEFVIVLENLNENAQEALETVDQITKLILANLHELYHLGDVDCKSTASIGIVLFGLHGRTQQELLKHADIAIYYAKKSGCNRATVYDESMQKDTNIE
jgi:diguanylate cyclase (GGDEF)-like protein